MELKKPPSTPAVLITRPNVRLLTIAPPVAEITAPPGRQLRGALEQLLREAAAQHSRRRASVLHHRGPGPQTFSLHGESVRQILAVALLIGITALTARLMTRPLSALAGAAAQAESGDLSVRVVPSGSTEVRLLGRAFNSMLQQLAGIQLRVRGEAAAAASQLAQASQELAGATQEQTRAATETSASMEELARSAVSIAGTWPRSPIRRQTFALGSRARKPS